MAAKFDYSLDYKTLDLRKNPEFYRVGKGEQGVLMVEPYRTEIVGHWRFKTPEIARESSAKIYEMFLEYKRQKDFVGMDMARKFLQMGITRARRYANHPSGRKYKKGTREIIPIVEIDEEKAESARIFSEKYYLAKNDELYQALMMVTKKIALRMRDVTPYKYVHERIVGTDVPHAHVHLIPFNESSQLSLTPDMDSEPDHTALAAMAEKLRIS